MRRSKCRQIILCLCLCLIAYSPLTLAESASEQSLKENVFTLGKITNNPRKQYKRLKPMADLLAHQLGLSGGDAVFTKNIDNMRKKMESGEVDLFTGSAYEAALLIKSGAGQSLALKSKEGTREYRSIIVTHIDSEIESIEQLEGKTIAFEDTNSTSAYRIPFIEIKKNGLSLKESRFEAEAHNQNAQNTVYYRFSGSEQNSSGLLFQRAVDAIALSDIDWNKIENVPKFQKSHFKIIHTSQAIPRALEIARSSLNEETKNSLQQILLNLHKNESSESVMMAYHKTTEFNPVSEDTLLYIEELGDYFKD